MIAPHGRDRWALPLALLWCLVLTATALALRPITPIDETRYATVAWEMWLSGDHLLLHLNGAPYGDKPPLLFWLINAGWGLFGVNSWWPKLLTAGFAFGTLVLVDRLLRRLAPGRGDIAAAGLLVSASGFYWMGFTGALMFDTALSFFVLMGICGVAWAGSGGGLRAWLLAGVAMGLGILTKGPVALLHVLPLALLAPWWQPALAAVSPSLGPGGRHTVRWPAWYGGIGVAVGVAAVLALAWAVPSALAGGQRFGREIFWNQSVDRIASTTHHLQPVWFYAALLPVLVFPWLLLPSFWRGLPGLFRRSAPTATAVPGLRLAIAWLLPLLLAFSLFRGKQLQYLLPEVPAIGFVVAAALASRTGWVRRADAAVLATCFVALALLFLAAGRNAQFARLVSPGDMGLLGWTVGGLLLAAAVVWRAPKQPDARSIAVVGLASVIVFVGLVLGFGRAVREGYDLRAAGVFLSGEQQAGRLVAHIGKYHGQFQFVGRLQQPLVTVNDNAAALAWAAEHPQGDVVVTTRDPPRHSGAVEPRFAQRYRSRWLSIWRGADLKGVALPTPSDRSGTDEP